MGYTGEGANITLSSEEDTLCMLATGDLSDDENADVFVDTAAAPTEDEREVFACEIAWVSLSGRQTTCFLLR